MKLVFATHNKNKAKEIASLLPSNFEILTLSDLDLQEEIPETENTLEGNAELKAAYIKDNFGLDCFADDTGLEVAALENAPGVRSARYAGEPANDDENIKLLLKNLEPHQDRSAQFRTFICLKIGNQTYHFEGIIKGTITQKCIGNKGFGYDPIFVPEGFTNTFAEMDLLDKNNISHRGKAIKKMVDFLSSF